MLCSQRRRTLSLKLKYQHRPSFTPVCNSRFQPKTTLFSLSRISQPHVRLSVFVLGVQFLDWGTNKRSYLYLRLVLSMSSLLDLRRWPRWWRRSSTPAHQPVIAAGLHAAKPPIQSTPASPFSLTAHQLELRDSSVVYACMRACVCVREFAATAPLSPVPFHSYKPRSVFIDAVYFVL